MRLRGRRIGHKATWEWNELLLSDAGKAVDHKLEEGGKEMEEAGDEESGGEEPTVGQEHADEDANWTLVVNWAGMKMRTQNLGCSSFQMPRMRITRAVRVMRATVLRRKMILTALLQMMGKNLTMIHIYADEGYGTL